ncbi:MAG: M14 family zinc carboxypeptidase, partial [Bacteroidota bacterium]|nr:M14 family zinc carboxypeptidase [Bacteroidota bacterium]
MKICKWVVYLILLTIFLSSCNSDIPKGDIIKLNYCNNETPTYSQIIDMYKQLDNFSGKAKLIEYGLSDVGKPLHLFVISANGNFNPETLHKKGKTVVFINNGIHPGEPCGIDASLQFANDILINKNNLDINLENTVICIIPVYNIG